MSVTSLGLSLSPVLVSLLPLSAFYIQSRFSFSTSIVQFCRIFEDLEGSPFLYPSAMDHQYYDFSNVDPDTFAFLIVEQRARLEEPENQTETILDSIMGSARFW